MRGLTVYTGSERASDADSARLADRENRADAAAGLEASDGPDEVLDILQELTSRETRSFSHRFAGRLVGELDCGGAAEQESRAAKPGSRCCGRMTCPPSCWSSGYLSSRKDLDLLMSEEWRGKAIASMGPPSTASSPRVWRGRGLPQFHHRNRVDIHGGQRDSSANRATGSVRIPFA